MLSLKDGLSVEMAQEESTQFLPSRAGRDVMRRSEHPSQKEILLEFAVIGTNTSG